MSAVIRSRVLVLLQDALEELRTHPRALTPKELAGLSLVAQAFDRPELAANLLRASWKMVIDESEIGG